MKIDDFKLEVFFGKYEFTAPYLLTQSDCESMTIDTLLSLETGAKETFLNSWLGYTEVAGAPELRSEIAQLYRSMSVDNVLVHAGAQEAIFNFMNVYLEEGDHVISQFPIYQSLYEVANSIGCEVSNWNIHQGHEGWFMDVDELETLIQPNTKLICMNNPNNPTGYILSDVQLEKVAEIARRHDVYVFCDEVYKGLELDGSKQAWFADLYEKGISLGVMSKAYGLPGLRIGWVATKDQAILEKMMKMKHYTTICSSGPSEFLATIALKHSEELLDRSRKIIERNLVIADAFFVKFSELFQYNRPMAGPVAFHKINVTLPIDKFVEQVVEDSGVLLLGADVYDYDGQYFRMGYGRMDFATNLSKLEAYLTDHGYGE